MPNGAGSVMRRYDRSVADLRITMRCPECGNRAEETMPLDRCVLSWQCGACQARVKPKAGDCCVYCSYGDKRCPPVQDG
ncbi:MAG: GDCCVxC domain-containing (seleno)protein [Terriglobales bacterium]